MMKLLPIYLVALMVSAPAVAAEPVNLECRLSEGKNVNPAILFEVNLREDVGSVDYVISGAADFNPPRAYKVTGIFTASAVSFGSFIINRETLAFSRTSLGSTDTGTCAIIKKTNRAF